MQRVILLIVLLLSLPALAEISAIQHAHEIRTQGFKLCSDLLVYYNNQEPTGAFDPTVREAYRQGLRELDTLSAAFTGKPAIASAVQSLKSSISELEKQPENARMLYTSALNPIMHAQRDLDEAAAAAYLAAGDTNPLITNLNQISLDMSRLLLLQQSKAFDNIGIHSVELDEQGFGKIDQRISEAHKRLLNLVPEYRKELDEVWRNYSFVRQRLLADDKGGASLSASRYLGKNVNTLNKLARNAQIPTVH